MPGTKKPENGGATSFPNDTATLVRCDECDQWFQEDNKEIIVNHVLHHCPVKAYECRFCDQEHHDLGEVKRHQMNVHNENDDVISHDSVFMRASYDVYMQRCFPNYDTGKLSIGRAFKYLNRGEAAYQCMVCKEMVYKSLAAHHIIEKNWKSEVYCCKICNFKCIFKSESDLHSFEDCEANLKLTSNDFPWILKMDFTDNSLFFLKSFFPKQIDPNDPDCHPELMRMARVLKNTFDKSVQMKELMEQDGLEQIQPTADDSKCRLCDMTGTPPFKTVHDMMLHAKSHMALEESQWKCPDGHCAFTSN